MDFVVITDNEVSKSGYTYDNYIGDHYTFPQKYKSWLKEGATVIYYKSKQQDGEKGLRLSKDAHYFGVAKVDKVYFKEKVGNNNLYVAKIVEYQPFKKAVPFRKPNGGHYEKDSTKWDIQSFRNGVRQIDEDIYLAILHDSGLSSTPSYSAILKDSGRDDFLSIEVEEGRPLKVYSTTYERNPSIRKKVLSIKGYRCCVCGFDFEEAYGPLGHEYIHVHHNKPLSMGIRKSKIAEDFDVVCPNCHSMLHKDSRKCLSVQELKDIFNANH